MINSDLIEVMDEKKTADIIHLYFSNEQQDEIDVPSNPPSIITNWSMQITPRYTAAPIFTFDDDYKASDNEDSATISYSPSSSARTPMVSTPNTDMYNNSGTAEMAKYGYKIVKAIDDTLRYVCVHAISFKIFLFLSMHRWVHLFCRKDLKRK